MDTWTFFTNHAHILFLVAADPDVRVRDLAVRVGITERASQRILADLAEVGIVTVERVGRRNRYTVNHTLHLRHPVEAHHTVGELITWMGPAPGRLTPSATPAGPSPASAGRSR